jgi:hypothetical protein
MPLFESCTDLGRDADRLRRRRYGMIEVIDGRLKRIVLRPWPTIPTWFEARLLGPWRHRKHGGKVCRLYYNQPRSRDNFLTLAYVESGRDAGLISFRGALAVLDEIARIKRSDFLVTDVANLRISDRLLDRWGWSPLAPRHGHRLYVKRYYSTSGCISPPDTSLGGSSGKFIDIFAGNS